MQKFLAAQAEHAARTAAARADCLEQLRAMLRPIASPECARFVTSKVADVIDKHNVFGGQTLVGAYDSKTVEAMQVFYTPTVHGLLAELAKAYAAQFAAGQGSDDDWPPA